MQILIVVEEPYRYEWRCKTSGRGSVGDLLLEFCQQLDFILHPEGPQQDAKTAADSENAHLCQALVQLLTPIFGQLLARDDDACMGSCQMLDALLRSSAAVRQAAACEMLKMG
ncbi:hypothetical protein WJX82_004253 [Trebouxia sp. C0006]